MSWWHSRKIWIVVLSFVLLMPLAAWAASEATITFSLGTADHLATLFESAAVCLTACGSFYIWINKTREARAKAISEEIRLAVSIEREAREDDVSAHDEAIAKISGDIETMRSSMAKTQDIIELRRLIEKVSDRADTQHSALRLQMTENFRDFGQRLDRLAERRTATRGEG